MKPKAGLSEGQSSILEKLAAGHRIVYSRDGECGWLSGTNDILADKDIWALRNRQFIIQIADEREDHYGEDEITAAGRRALSQLKGSTT